jgi:hypothetical protein
MPILATIAGLIQAMITFMQHQIAAIIDGLVSAEYISLGLFPHYRYQIVCGGGVRSGRCVGTSHMMSAVVFTGADTAYYTVHGSGYRNGRQVYIPMVGSLVNIPIMTWVGTTITSCAGAGTSVSGSDWYARVRFKCINPTNMYFPPFSLYDFAMLGALDGPPPPPPEAVGAIGGAAAGALSQAVVSSKESTLLSAIISSGMLLGPAALWMVSQMMLRLIMANFTQNRDFELAMTPAGLQQYIRVE